MVLAIATWNFDTLLDTDAVEALRLLLSLQFAFEMRFSCVELKDTIST